MLLHLPKQPILLPAARLPTTLCYFLKKISTKRISDQLVLVCHLPPACVLDRATCSTILAIISLIISKGIHDQPHVDMDRGILSFYIRTLLSLLIYMLMTIIESGIRGSRQSCYSVRIQINLSCPTLTFFKLQDCNQAFTDLVLAKIFQSTKLSLFSKLLFLANRL